VLTATAVDTPAAPPAPAAAPPACAKAEDDANARAKTITSFFMFISLVPLIYGTIAVFTLCVTSSGHYKFQKAAFATSSFYMNTRSVEHQAPANITQCAFVLVLTFCLWSLHRCAYQFGRFRSESVMRRRTTAVVRGSNRHNSNYAKSDENSVNGGDACAGRASCTGCRTAGTAGPFLCESHRRRQCERHANNQFFHPNPHYPIWLRN
jgi:hypothetical protein